MPPRAARLADVERLDLARRVRLLSWASLAYMSLEGGVAILAGLTAGSVALIGFGIDSAIEGFASAIIVWRFTGHRAFSAPPRPVPRSSSRSSSSSSPHLSATSRRRRS